MEGPVPSSHGEAPRAPGASPASVPSHRLDSATIRDLAPEVVVSDLDGVPRVFDPALWTRLARRIGLPPQEIFRAVLGNPLPHEVTRGRATHAQWRSRAQHDLVALGVSAHDARWAVDTWAATPARVDADVVSALREARDRGIPVFVFTNGTDRVREEVSELGLDDLTGPDGTHLLNSAELGAAKPDREAFVAAHRRIEQVLGRPVPRDGVAFFDDSRSHVEGARAFGWTAVLHRP